MDPVLSRLILHEPSREDGKAKKVPGISNKIVFGGTRKPHMPLELDNNSSIKF